MPTDASVDRVMMHLKARDYSAAASRRSHRSYGQYLAISNIFVLVCGFIVKHPVSASKIKLTAKVIDGFFMVALWNRADHYIFALWFLSIFFFFLA